MKRKYIKPAFVMEHFDLAQSIAAGCTAEDPANPNSSIGDPNWGDKNVCGWEVLGYVVWTGPNPGCDVKERPDKEILGFCYNNPNGDNIIFAS